MPDLIATIKRHDLLPPLTVSCTYADGTAVDLTGATVRFLMRLDTAADGSTPKITATATLLDAAGGLLRYSWAGTDTDTIGTYRAEFEATLGGKQMTFPQREKLIVNVVADLA